MSPTSFQLIAALVRRETAMVYDAGKEYLVEARLLPLAVAAGCADVNAYVGRITLDAAERRKALDVLTINETSWFRDLAPYTAFTEHMLPHLLEQRQRERHLRIWSAACSSGQEAYSLTMLLDEHLPAGWTAARPDRLTLRGFAPIRPPLSGLDPWVRPLKRTRDR